VELCLIRYKNASLLLNNPWSCSKDFTIATILVLFLDSTCGPATTEEESHTVTPKEAKDRIKKDTDSGSSSSAVVNSDGVPPSAAILCVKQSLGLTSQVLLRNTIDKKHESSHKNHFTNKKSNHVSVRIIQESAIYNPAPVLTKPGSGSGSGLWRSDRIALQWANRTETLKPRPRVF
jgi:hypothetical protein